MLLCEHTMCSLKCTEALQSLLHGDSASSHDFDVAKSVRRHTLGRRMTSPEGVKTKTPRPRRSSVMQSTNSRADRLFTNSLCHSRMLFSQLIRRVMTC